MSPTAKKGTQDRVEYNGFSDGKTLRTNEQICRPGNEDRIRGISPVTPDELHTLIVSGMKQFANVSYEAVESAIIASLHEAGLEVRV